MNIDRKDFLDLMQMPARLSVDETAWYLGFMAHDVPVLVRARLLTSLVRSPQAVKYFATVTLAKLRNDTRWLARASEVITKHWRTKNTRNSIKREAGCSLLNRHRNLGRSTDAVRFTNGRSGDCLGPLGQGGRGRADDIITP